MAALNHPTSPPTLTNPFSASFSSTTTSSSTTYTSTSSSPPSNPRSDSNPSHSQHPTNPASTEDDDSWLNRTHTRSPDGRRNSSGEILPSPTENWKPTFNRVQSWNREDRKREIALEREIVGHEGVGGGFSEK